MGDKLSVVTGATGHVGYALVKELEARGENFRILIRKDSKIFDGINCERVFGDVTDPALSKRLLTARTSSITLQALSR